MQQRRGKRLAIWGALALCAVLIAAVYACWDHLRVKYWVWRHPNTLLAELLSPSVSDQEILDSSRSIVLDCAKLTIPGIVWHNHSGSALLRAVGVEPDFSGKLHGVFELRVADLEPLKAGLSTAGGAKRVLLGRVLAVTGMPREPSRARKMPGPDPDRSDAAELVAMAEWLKEARIEARRAAAGAFAIAAMRPLYFHLELWPVLHQVPQLIQSTSQDRDPVVRSRIALAHFIITALSRGDGATTQVPPEALPCLDDEEPFIRQIAAIWCLFRSADPERAAGVLVATLDNAWLGEQDLAALMREKPEPALAACRKLLPDPNRKTALYAAMILRWLAIYKAPGAKEALWTADATLMASADEEIQKPRPPRQLRAPLILRALFPPPPR